jgi:hypothetical protein
MVAKRIISILILTHLSFSFFSQSILDSLNYSVDSALLNLKVDKLNNKWYIYEHKIVRSSSEIAYNDTLYFQNIGDVQLDLQIPLKNLFFHKSSNTIEINNSRWGVLSKFRLDQLQIYQPTFVKFTLDKMILVLDVSNNSLYKINENGVKISQNPNPFKIGNQSYFPTQIIQLRNQSLALDTNYGLFIINEYGNLIQHIPLKSYKYLFEYKGNIYLTQGRGITRYEMSKLEEVDNTSAKKAFLPYPIKSIQTYNENALILFENKRIYELKTLDSLFK